MKLPPAHSIELVLCKSYWESPVLALNFVAPGHHSALGKAVAGRGRGPARQGGSAAPFWLDVLQRCASSAHSQIKVSLYIACSRQHARP